MMSHTEFILFMLGLAGIAAADLFAVIINYRRSKKWKNYRCTQPVDSSKA